MRSLLYWTLLLSLSRGSLLYGCSDLWMCTDMHTLKRGQYLSLSITPPSLDSWYNGFINTTLPPESIMIIALSNQAVNVGKKVSRVVYTLDQGKSVVKASSKQRVLKLSPRRVMHGGLFNNPTLVATLTTGSALCTVGVKTSTCERKFEVPVVWQADPRGNMRRHIRKSDFLALPQLLQDIAIANGVNINGSRITFSRCVAAWAGHQVKGMHVHHVNMDSTDDRLANLWVMTPKEHAAVHADATDLLYDKDWFEYTSQSVLQLRLDELYTLSTADMAVPIPPDDHSISDEELAALYKQAPSFEEVMANLQAMLGRAGIAVPVSS